MADQIKAQFMLKIHGMAEERLDEGISRITDQNGPTWSEAAASLKEMLETLLEVYGQLQKDGQTEALRWIYISFLRTSLTDRRPLYRIDLYDERNQVSEVECAGSWDFKGVSDCLFAIGDELKSEFDRQTRVKEYELDEVVYQAADRLNREVEAVIPQLLTVSLNEIAMAYVKDQVVDVMFGELFDQANLAVRWDRNRVISADEVRREEEEERE